MSGVDFEYAIKTDVRNNPIVREIDEARQRQIRRSLAIGGLLVAVMLFSAWQNATLVPLSASSATSSGWVAVA